MIATAVATYDIVQEVAQEVGSYLKEDSKKQTFARSMIDTGEDIKE